MTFASLLPGVRELRAPLAAGYVWLLVIWLVASRVAGPRWEAPEPIASLGEIEKIFGAAGLAIALSFAAYLIGSLSVAAWGTVSRVSDFGVFAARESRRPHCVATLSYLESDGGFAISLDEAANRRARADEEPWVEKTLLIDSKIPRAELSAAGQQSLQVAVADELRRLAAEFGDDVVASALREVVGGRELIAFLEEEERARGIEFSYGLAADLEDETRKIRAIPERLFHEAEQIRLRLERHEPTVFATIDRIRSEAEFRLALVLPLVALVIVVVAVWTPWWLAVVPLVLATYVDGLNRKRAANDLLADALQITDVKAPTFERLRVVAARVTAEGLPDDHPLPVVAIEEAVGSALEPSPEDEPPSEPAAAHPSHN